MRTWLLGILMLSGLGIRFASPPNWGTEGPFDGSSPFWREFLLSSAIVALFLLFLLFPFPFPLFLVSCSSTGRAAAAPVRLDPFGARAAVSGRRPAGSSRAASPHAEAVPESVADHPAQCAAAMCPQGSGSRWEQLPCSCREEGCAAAKSGAPE